MRRIRGVRRSKRKPKTFGQIFMMTVVVFIIATLLSVWLINRGIEPTLIEMAETKTNQFAREAINEAVSRRIVDDLEADEILDIETDESGNIVSMNWNSVVINRVLRNTTFRVQNFLKRIERGEITPEESLDFDLEHDVVLEEDTVEDHRAIVRIPIGQATNNALLANLGPQVPVNFRIIGDVQSDVERRVTEYGINNALIELDIFIQANVQVVIPFATKTTTVETHVPVSIGVIQGEVPDFYNQGGGSSPDISIPYRDLQE
ncbi:sporulation protein YunB [Alkalibacillus salilacus]|uniref:Sporulation protein YunB n=1 Tax=Alkalibacillus salilacus TaxID=284582 RepID=A0ABT9VEX7_9BACI|nr:sporulation protein YunB [Alkalibacillus salilacus]MDQ0159519.1 sporulation protein YunB [Alkalibacillus salilacus]